MRVWRFICRAAKLEHGFANGKVEGEWRHGKNILPLLTARSLRNTYYNCRGVDASHLHASNDAKIKAFGYRDAKKIALQNYQ